MSEETESTVPWTFWAIGAVALIWNVLGVMNYLGQMNPEAIAAYPESHRAIIEGRPAWATSGFAIAVWGGSVGCVLLLLKKSAAIYLFLASLLGAIVTMIHTIGVAVTVDFGGFEIVMMILSPIVVAGLLIWYANRAETRGWIR